MLIRDPSELTFPFAIAMHSVPDGDCSVSLGPREREKQQSS